MKKFLSFLSFLFLTSCQRFTPSISTGVSNSSSEEISSVEESLSTSSSDSSSVSLGERDISLYAINDFHGAIKTNGNEAGILKVGSFFKEKGKEENTLIINSGDMYQGSLLSNENRGEFLTKVMNNVEFDCFTLGNHEFDWGSEYIDINRMMEDETTHYQTPFLAANIYNYDIATSTVKDYANLGEKYVIKTLENGTKVGIIGCIGKDQITSITSSIVDGYTFLDPISVTKELSDELRIEKGCEVVILSLHADEDVALNQGLTNVSPISNKKYVDAVFCAHSHQREKTIENGVPFVQASSSGKAYASVNLHISDKGDVTCTSYDFPYTSSISVDTDSEILSIYNSYLSYDTGSEVIGTLNGNLSQGVTGETVSLLATDSIAWACKKYASEYSIDYTICNTSRDSLSSGNITYEALFKALPFDNDIYIGTCTGRELANELKYAAFTRLNKSAIVNKNTYTIAVIDYLGTHRNARRQHDYFPNFSLKKILKKNGLSYNYREITRDFIKEEQDLDASDYSSTLDIHNPDKKYQAIN